MTLVKKYHDFMKKANKKLKTKEDVIQFQKELKKNEELMTYRKYFIEEIMYSVTQMMGDTIVWYQTMPCVKLYDDDGVTDSDYQRVLCDLHKDRSFGEDSVIIHDYHWNCMKDGDEKVFDPYNGYQIPKTYQLCQTYNMMYLTDNLPKFRENKDFINYYYYTKKALEFAYNVLMADNLDWKILEPPPKLTIWNGRDTPRKMKHTMKKCLEMCLKYPNACLNLIWID